jgi:LacI family transcriptional regulator
MASLVDVALRAGVSVATASRTLNRSTHPVSAATRRRVEDAARELGYRPSSLAQALVTRMNRVIGVIVGDIVDPYFAEVVRAVEDSARGAGYLTIVCNADRNPAQESAHLGMLRNYQAAGVIFAGSGFAGDDGGDELAQLVAQATEQGMHVISLARRDLPVPLVGYDNHAVGRDLTVHLISSGYRRIAFVGGLTGLYGSMLRREGYERAMAEAGLESSATDDVGMDHEAGHAATVGMLVAGQRPDAIIGVNDEAAIGALMALERAGIEVPREVAVASIGDTPPARFFELTTVRLPLYETAAMAAGTIVAGTGASALASETLLAHRLIERATTARAGNARRRARRARGELAASD